MQSYVMVARMRSVQIMSNFSNSPLINLTNLSPYRNSPRNQPIRKITVHHFAGNATIEAVSDFLRQPGRNASYNYGIGSDGRIVLIVNERDRCWGSSSPVNDHQAVVIGVANNTLAPTWGVSNAAFESLINLITCICERNPGIVQQNGSPGLWYDGTANGNKTRHNMFANTLCPGQFLQSRFPEIVRRVNERLGSAAPASLPQGVPEQAVKNAPYRLHVPLPGFMNAADAMANRNPRNKQHPGVFFVFNTSGQAVNITRTQGRAGSWINGALNIPPIAAPQAPNTVPPNALRFDIFGKEHFIDGSVTDGRASAVVRDLLEAIGGLKVDWDGLTRTVIVRRKQ